MVDPPATGVDPLTPRRLAWLRPFRSSKRPLTCKEMVELVTEYLEGTLDEANQSRFEAHLAGCDGCSAYLDELRVTVRTVGTIGSDEMDPVFRDRLIEAFAETSGSW